MEKGMYTLKSPCIDDKNDKEKGRTAGPVRVYRESWEDFLGMLDHLSVGVLLKDWNYAYCYCNESYARQLGLAKDSILGRRDHEILGFEMAQEALSSDKRVLEGTNEEHQTIWNLGDPVHGNRWVSIRKQPIWNERGEIVYLLGVAEEISGNGSKKPDECRNEAGCVRCGIYSDMNAEIQTALSAIMGMAQIARETDNTQTVESCLHKIYTASSALLCVIHHLFDVPNDEMETALSGLKGYLEISDPDADLEYVGDLSDATGHLDTLKAALEKEGIVLD